MTISILSSPFSSISFFASLSLSLHPVVMVKPRSATSLSLSVFVAKGGLRFLKLLARFFDFNYTVLTYFNKILRPPFPSIPPCFHPGCRWWAGKVFPSFNSRHLFPRLASSSPRRSFRNLSTFATNCTLGCSTVNPLVRSPTPTPGTRMGATPVPLSARTRNRARVPPARSAPAPPLPSTAGFYHQFLAIAPRNREASLEPCARFDSESTSVNRKNIDRTVAFEKRGDGR